MRKPFLVAVLSVLCASHAAAQARFRPGVNEAALNSPSLDLSPAITKNHLKMWFISNRPGGAGGQDIYTSSRASIAAPWTAPTVDRDLSSTSGETSIGTRTDGRELFFGTNRPGGQGGRDLWTVGLAGTKWLPAVPVVELSSPSNDDTPTVRGDGLEVIFASDRPGTLGRGALWRSKRGTLASAWSTPERIAELDTLFAEANPALSDDGLTLYFSSDRLDGGGANDIWMAKRTDVGSSFGAPVNVTELNTAGAETAGDFTSDEFTLYYSTDANNSDIFRADAIGCRTVSTGQAHAGQAWSVWARRDPGNVGWIALSMAERQQPVEVPGWSGRLELADPVYIVKTGTCDENGRLEYGFKSLPFAAGTVLYWQGFAKDPDGSYHFGNKLTMTVEP
jgi:hypothetical protein